MFTLENGVQIQILVDAEDVSKALLTDSLIQIEGFVTTPFVVRKQVVIKGSDVSAVEVTEDPNVVWTAVNTAIPMPQGTMLQVDPTLQR